MQHIVKVLSLWQPWATLIAMGAKPVETRQKAIHYRGKLYIHAAKQFAPDHMEMCRTEPFSKYIPDPGKLPLGKIIGYCDVVGCYSTEAWMKDDAKMLHKKYGVTKGSEVFKFGDFSEGRYGIELEDMVMLKEPIPARGYPWAFDFDISAYL